MQVVTVGNVVPDFECPSTAKSTFKLADYRGRYGIVYFYPKDNTPGCTQEAQAFRDDYAQFTALDVWLVGVSRDSVRVHDGFKTKQGLPFELLSDGDEALCHLFDVIKMKAMYGKQVRGIERSTFLIGPDGVLLREWRKVKVKGHSQEGLQVLTSLIGNPV